MLDEHQAPQAARIVIGLQRNVPTLCAEHGFEAKGLESEAYDEVAKKAVRDIQRLLIYQAGNLEFLKYSAYISFWFRKLQPIRDAARIRADGTAFGVARDLNERCAVWLMGCSQWTHYIRKDEANGLSIRKKYREFFSSPDFEYAIDSMRNRTFGPHHFVLLAKMIER